MKKEMIAMIFHQGGMFISEMIKNRHVKKPQSIAWPKVDISEEIPQEGNAESLSDESKASSVEAGCVPCAIGHFGTCSGLLNEAMRFAKKEGIGSSEVIDRVNMCLDELNSMERVDLRSELIVNLFPWEKELADKALVESRATRHGLESLTSVDALEKVTANTQTARQDIGRAWFKKRLANTSPEEKKKIAEKLIEKMEEVPK